MISAEEIDSKKTPAGGWTKAQLAEWGVDWPPPKGWRKKLIAEHLEIKRSKAIKEREELLKDTQ